MIWLIGAVSYSPKVGTEIKGKWSTLEPGSSRYMGVSLDGGTPKSSILIGFSIINHPFWGTPIFGNPHLQLSAFGRFFGWKVKRHKFYTLGRSRYNLLTWKTRNETSKTRSDVNSNKISFECSVRTYLPIGFWSTGKKQISSEEKPNKPILIPTRYRPISSASAQWRTTCWYLQAAPNRL